MRLTMCRRLQLPQQLLKVSILLLLASPLAGQGRSDYFNIESPQVHPIEVARVNGHDYILAVNTPDNSVEIWDTDETLPTASRFLHRVRVGLEPVSVRWVPAMERFYVANFLGDSITAVALTASGGPATLSPQVAGTVEVTDEPLDIAFAQVPDPEPGRDPIPTLFVTHMTLDAFGAYHAVTLAPTSTGSERMDASVLVGDIDFDGQPDEIALKEPWAARVACDRLFLLGHKGGNTVLYDMDVYSQDLSGGTQRLLAGLGSTNWNMAFASTGDLYVVGGEALNVSLFGEPAVSGAKTGFVEHTFYWVENPCTANPTIHRRDINEAELVLQQPGQPTGTGTTVGGSVASGAETAGAGTGEGFPIGMLSARAGALVAQPTIGPVNKGQALAQPTDVLPFEVGGAVTKVFLVAYNSDRLGVLEPVAGVVPIKWKRRRVNIPQIRGSASMTGPRGLALKTANAEQELDPGARLYILNRIDQSVSVIDPVSETVVTGAGFALDNDPTPPWIHAGRRFLYSAKLGNGFNSCASCHTDARTDGLAWDLSDGNQADIPEHLLPTPDGGFPAGNPGKFPADKGFMVTQSLQGLLNFEVPPEIQHLFTNAPYHWRGDRADFTIFNPAFAGLLGGTELFPDDMDLYEDFINSVNYPPNPKQSRDRILSGDLGDPDDNDTTQTVSGDGALRGLKLFHIRASDGVGACVHCHFFSEGSNNILTEDLAGTIPHPPQGLGGTRQPIETAALRGLFQKEARLDRDGSSFHDNSPVTGYEGLFHTGLVFPPGFSNDFNATATINAFNLFFFTGRFCQGALPAFCDNLQSLNQVVHEFDFGAGPVIGKSYTVTSTNVFTGTTVRAFDTAETQAQVANGGAVVLAWIGGARRGFWYDLTGTGSGIYREEPSGATFSRLGLLSMVSGVRDRLVLISTPLGSERRLADPKGQPTLLTGPAPSVTDFLGMVTNTAYADIPSLSVFWAAGAGCVPPGCLPERHGGTTPHTVRLYQNALLTSAPPGGFGLCSVRHEAPRRFRVLGENLRHGATLHLFIQDDPGGPPPDTTLRVDDPGQVATLELVLPLHPTGLTVEGDLRVWETAVEMEPMLFYRLMAGPPSVAGILDAVTDVDFKFQIFPESSPTNPPGLSWSPTIWNQHWVRVVNTDGTQVDLGWQPLTIEPGPDCP